MRTESEIDVLVLGGSGVDTIVYVPELPLPLADSHPVPAIETRSGQTGDFLAMATHTLGLRTHHLDMLGDDLPHSRLRSNRGDPGCLFGRLTGEPPRRCGLYGAIAGACACTVPSTRTDSISRAELLARAAELSP